MPRGVSTVVLLPAVEPAVPADGGPPIAEVSP